MHAIDFHDDPHSVLATMTPEDLNELGHVEVLAVEDLAKIATNRFALVVRDGEDIHRKFLCDSPDATRLSVAAFNKTASILPIKMRKVAGANLGEAAALYGVNPPRLSCDPVDGNLVDGKLPKPQEKVASAPDLDDCRLQSLWFEDFVYDIPPWERRTIAVKLASDFSAHRVPAPAVVSHYAGEGFGTEMKSAIVARRAQLTNEPEFVEALDGLEKNANELGPEGLAAGLLELDVVSGLNNLWDSLIPDPYRTVYSGSSSLQKEASHPMAEKIDLHAGKLRETFGEQFYKDLADDPDSIVEALPKPERELFEQILGG